MGMLMVGIVRSPQLLAGGSKKFERGWQVFMPNDFVNSHPRNPRDHVIGIIIHDGYKDLVAGQTCEDFQRFLRYGSSYVRR